MQLMNGISEGNVIYKAGKLIRIKAIFEGDKIRTIKITGDFFLYPEDAIEDIEKSLKDKSVGEVGEILREKMKNLEYEGISPNDLSIAINEAWRRRKLV